MKSPRNNQNNRLLAATTFYAPASLRKLARSSSLFIVKMLLDVLISGTGPSFRLLSF